ncbi:helix-turn-helix transcriptional regulator [Cupriavidus gilardii]|uniref:Helix-turn-helix transcriptional regulator n=1 Tax=Cupriavidus gilardii TaxID=82541 RepID=A0A6N1BSQ7_9BURK|nr:MULTISPECIES: helix-turn-helix transcriptional regulator [Cupriavidus]QQE08704.1 helix-turn-helix transcriptional regulator [Cupriavidus sp. ISTL7]ESJ17427.1 XRE family transcriptional regulator [Cupriavidus sp. HPC(L)]KAB0599303.1 helix-turn-helix transcriptional regulator [Cupriavidus gilardii]MCD9119789.1 helix-turn-helix transcriptional regulator [Cupriavidus sp. UGS-1]MCT9013227.1 helix-turn-helix transcriptional regulator [Cupriavidus gilardii]
MNSTAVPRGASEPFRQLRALRRARKLKQEDVARKAGISREAYLRAESGQADPRMSTFLAACEALGLEVVLAPQHLAQDVNAFIASRNGGVTAASMAGPAGGASASSASSASSGGGTSGAGGMGSPQGEGQKPV